MLTATFTPQDIDARVSAFSALSDLARSAQVTQDRSPWMTHSMTCRCTLCR